MNDFSNTKIDIDALLEACHVVSNVATPQESISQLLAILVNCVGLEKARVLMPDENRTYRVVYQYGLTPEEERMAIYKFGEGITGQVVLKNKIVLIPDVKDEPRFLGKITDISIFNQTKISFIGIPIAMKRQGVCVLSVNRLNADSPVLENDLIVLQLFSAFIKQALEIHEFLLLETKQLQEENRQLKYSLSRRRQDIIGSDPALLHALESARQSAKSNASVLLMGESGTGKERFAQYIHQKSPRCDKEFVAINCAAIPNNLLESELFGHEKGAFTGADKFKIGKFEAADGGTLFLDEIGDMNADVQAKLLRVLQESEIVRLGSNKVRKVDVRIVAATHQNIQDAIGKGRFRLDLFYRLNVITLKLPALRERKGDIALLARFFLERANAKYGKHCRFTQEILKTMKDYSWPGNIRQLENIVERCVILSEREEIEHSLLASGLEEPGTISLQTERSEQQHNDLSRPYRPANHLPRESIVQAVRNAHGNKTHAARTLGISARQLHYRIQKLGIIESEFL
ncbi:MAG: sigma 54-interacting transcriptional regulator [Gammaproteobacteria bacterium]|nr:sigma 54-interacting transcriptional regulator [Gammaproteobacteria bacterium]